MKKLKKKKRKKKYILLRLNSRKKIKETLWGIFLDLFINIEDTALKIYLDATATSNNNNNNLRNFF